jgi:hypothetical protein
MDDLLWLTNHSLRGNVAGIPTSRNPNTPEGLESWLSVRIHRIPVELPHSTELELGKLRRTRMDSGRASALELLRGAPTSWEVLRPSEPHLSLLCKEWTWEHYRKLNLTFFTLFAERKTRVFIGGLNRCFGRKWGSGGSLVKPIDQLGWPGGQVSWPHRLWVLDAPCTELPWHVGKAEFEKTPTPGRSAPLWLSWA